MPCIRVIAPVIARGDKLLDCQRPLHKRHGELWEFPSGKLEPCEDDETAAAEFELADASSPFLIAFVPVEASGTPVCREHTALMWGTPSELALLPLAPSDRHYVELLLARAAA